MKAEVKMHRGTPTLYLDGEPSYYSCQWMSSDPAEEGFPAEGAVRAFGEAGVHLYAIGPPCFKDGREAMYDFSNYELALDKVMSADPQAHFHLRLYFETPEWWNEENPDVSDSGDPQKSPQTIFENLLEETLVGGWVSG